LTQIPDFRPFKPSSGARRELPDVTLVAVDGTTNPAATAASLAAAASLVAFARTLLLSPVRPADAAPELSSLDWIEIPPLTLKGYNQFCLADLHRFITTSHCLTVQGDSRIVNPGAWDDGWLAFDYIGAPWPPGHTGTPYRVGNSGFCLRSRRLLQATASLPNDSYVWRGQVKPSSRDDVITCVMYREHLEALGLSFAPVDVAARFAFESVTPESPALSDQFGTHELRASKRRAGP
jgi:hypothetical protein